MIHKESQRISASRIHAIVARPTDCSQCMRKYACNVCLGVLYHNPVQNILGGPRERSEVLVTPHKAAACQRSPANGLGHRLGAVGDAPQPAGSIRVTVRCTNAVQGRRRGDGR